MLKDCEADRQAFFALVLHLYRTRKKINNPAGVLTSLLRGSTDKFGQTWKTKSKDKDHEQARKMIKELDFPKEEPTSEYCEFEELELPDQDPEDPDELEEAEEQQTLPESVLAQLRETQERRRREVQKI